MHEIVSVNTCMCACAPCILLSWHIPNWWTHCVNTIYTWISSCRCVVGRHVIYTHVDKYMVRPHTYKLPHTNSVRASQPKPET